MTADFRDYKKIKSPTFQLAHLLSFEYMYMYICLSMLNMFYCFYYYNYFFAFFWQFLYTFMLLSNNSHNNDVKTRPIKNCAKVFQLKMSKQQQQQQPWQ